MQWRNQALPKTENENVVECVKVSLKTLDGPVLLLDALNDLLRIDIEEQLL